MAKIPFSIDYRPQIESGEYKVETRDGKPVRIICWDKKSEKKYGYHIVGLVEFGPQHEESTYYTIDGKGRLKDKEPELFVVIPEPELTEFEKALADTIGYAISQSVVEPNYETYKFVKDWSERLLNAAKKELCKGCAANLEGYIKGRQDALKEMEENRVYKHEGPTPPVPVPVPVPAFWPPCHYGGECTNPFHDCINCPRQSTIGINTTTGTSTAKVDSHE